jgi:nucleoside-diphosphate-sugar epimerase
MLGVVERLVVLGCGYAGTAVARLARARGVSVLTNVRSDARASALRAEGFAVLQAAALDATIADHVDASTHVVVAFPPDGATDARVAPSLARAASVTYLSSTGVYGDYRGVVDESTPVPVAPSARGAKTLAAEALYRAAGGTVLRCPALYGRDRGLHVRVLRGEHQIPGDGTRHLSRIHVEDLALFVLASASASASASGAEPAPSGATLLVGDLEPAPHVDVVRFICATYGVPMPPFVPLESVPESLRADRSVDASRTIAKLGVKLRYPSYREGMARAATGLSPPFR